MNSPLIEPCTAFAGNRLLASGPQIEVALALKNAADGGDKTPLLAFHDATGEVMELDLRGTKADLIARLSVLPSKDSSAIPASESRGPGRPKLGVTAREVTLLPRHWEWLAGEPGGASVALRRLVEEASRTSGPKRKARASRDAAYRFMSAMAGDFPAFEEASRALFANDQPRFKKQMAGWPEDVRAYALRLAFGES